MNTSDFVIFFELLKLFELENRSDFVKLIVIENFEDLLNSSVSIKFAIEENPIEGDHMNHIMCINKKNKIIFNVICLLISIFE